MYLFYYRSWCILSTTCFTVLLGTSLSVQSNPHGHFHTQPIRKSVIGKDFGPLRTRLPSWNEEDGCTSSYDLDKAAKSILNTLEIYKTLEFDNRWGGAWTQGWDIEIDEQRFTEKNKLKVFVIPHSHCDPGWLETFERYYEKWVNDILNNMVENLSKNHKMKLIWAEMSFFDLWWSDLSDEKKAKVKKIISNGQLEFVTGGWVMPDESSSHFFSLLTELREGHQWLYNHLGYVPRNGWSIDPFGMSPTMAYLLRRSGLKHMLIQRTHYEMKKYLAKKQSLEFKWRQLWDSEANTDILCHMMPFYHYDVPYTCGPDPNVCCAYDFRRLENVSMTRCAHKQPEQIGSHNVQRNSIALLDQYKMKVMLYKTNTVLVPLGEDFYWENQKQWTANMYNYQMIFDYINANEDFSTEIKFGTLEDYFSTLENHISSNQFHPPDLTGDFFSYSDMNDDYWTGYFTSRPFYKAMDRDLMSHLRSANILYSIMYVTIFTKQFSALNTLQPLLENLSNKLVDARRHLSLFQHHDGISGTAKDHVMVDYGEKMFDGLAKTNYVMKHCIHILTHFNTTNLKLVSVSEASKTLEQTLERKAPDVLPEYSLLNLNEFAPQILLSIFNPIAHRRTQLVNVYVSTYNVKVVDLSNNIMNFEILPVFEDKFFISDKKYLLTILVDMDGLAIKNLKVILLTEESDLEAPKIYYRNGKLPHHEFFSVKSSENHETFEIENSHLKVSFDTNGLASSVTLLEKKKTYPFKLGMFQYHATAGLYLFRPNGPAEEISLHKPFIKVVQGRLQSYVEVWFPQVIHRVTVYRHLGLEKYSVEITNIVDIRNENNFELMMRLDTKLASGSTFYTDLNGFQMMHRENFRPKLPIQGNYYPMSSAAYIEDKKLRVTVLSKQPQGVSSLSSGTIDLMLDRRLDQDDHRGVGQGSKDNKETISSFKILFETLDCVDMDASKKSPMLSLAAHLTSDMLQYPIQTFSRESKDSKTRDCHLIHKSSQIPCDVLLVDMPSLPSYNESSDGDNLFSNNVGMLLHRVGFDARFSKDFSFKECNINKDHLGRFRLTDWTGSLFPKEYDQMTLTFTKKGDTSLSKDSVILSSNEIYAFSLKF